MSIVQRIAWTFGAALLALVLYAADGYRDALRDAPRLKTLANVIIDDGRGPAGLTDWQLAAYLTVETSTPHDTSNPGEDARPALTQTLAKRFAFKDYHPLIGSIRQTAYARALGDQLETDEILALALDLAPMGDKDGRWITGVHTASEAFFAEPVADLEERDFLSLLAVMIAPGDLNIAAPDPALQRRILRIERLLRGDCTPSGTGDIWLEGCRVS
ncbi:MAG: transglycosylase domain-containing protein [Pseudomonadota bacterium]